MTLTSDFNSTTAKPASNREFLQTIFGDDWKRALICSFKSHDAGDKAVGRNGQSPWTTYPAGQYVDQLPPDGNGHYCISLTDDGRRTVASFESLHVIVIDDIGTKLDPAVLDHDLPNPTFELETSPGNFQVGYKLDKPLTDARVYDAIVDAISRKSPLNPEGVEPGMAGVNRYMRLPFSANSKTKYHAITGLDRFQHILHAWRPDRTFTIEQIAKAFNADLSEEALSRTSSAKEGLGKTLTDEEVASDRIMRIFNRLGMVKSKKPNSQGFFDVTCPWVAEHTGGVDDGSAYKPGYGFRCHHGHCDKRRLPELVEWADSVETPDEKQQELNRVFTRLHRQSNGTAPGNDSDPIPCFDPWERMPVPPFPLEILPERIRAFILAKSDGMGFDPTLGAWSALSAASGAIDHRCKIQLTRYTHFFAHPRLWLLVCGSPGSMKTPTNNLFSRAIRQRQSTEQAAYKAFKPDAQEDDGKKKKKSVQEDPGPPPPKVRIIDNTTTEALVKNLSTQDSGIYVSADELGGWLGNMEKYSKNNTADRALWLQAWNGGGYTNSRVIGGLSYVNNLSVSIYGGIQPARLSELGNLSSDGLLQRFFVCFVNDTKFRKDAPDDTGPVWDNIINELMDMPDRQFTMSEEGFDVVHDLHESLHTLGEAMQDSDNMRAFVLKLAGMSGSIMLILHLMEHGKHAPHEVSATTARNVTKLVKSHILAHARAFYDLADQNSDRLNTTHSTASWILTHTANILRPSDFTKNVAKLRGLRSWDLEQALSVFVAGGWLAPDKPRPNHWVVNPNLRTAMAKYRDSEATRKAALGKMMNAQWSVDEPEVVEASDAPLPPEPAPAPAIAAPIVDEDPVVTSDWGGLDEDPVDEDDYGLNPIRPYDPAKDPFL